MRQEWLSSALLLHLQMPFPDASFDCAIDTFSMCVLNEQATAALKEARADPPADLRASQRQLRPRLFVSGAPAQPPSVSSTCLCAAR